MTDNIRTVKITCLPERYDNIVELTGHHVITAIHYLITWALGSKRYLNVDLHIQEDGEIIATYHDKDGKITYVMGGIWHNDENRYSFHS